MNKRDIGDDGSIGDVSSQQPLSHLQWYLHHSRNTVFLAAESSKHLTEYDLLNIAQLFMNYAPQLNTKVDSSGNMHLNVGADAKSIFEFDEMADLNAALSNFINKHDVVYNNHNLPNFRAVGSTNKQFSGCDPGSLYACMSSHALMEGSESARILQCRPSVQHAERADVKLGFVKHTIINAAGYLLAPMHFIASRFNKKNINDGKWLILDLNRKDIKKIASHNNVSQRSVLFSLPLHGLQFPRSHSTKNTKRAHTVSYSTLPKKKTILEDSALNLRMQVARFSVANDFLTYLQEIEEVIGRENTTEIHSQAFYNAILGVHRKIHRLLPSLYDDKFFTYVPYDFVLSLLPPHMASGQFRRVIDGSIFCGSYTPGVNSCVFVPHRNGISLNLFLDPQTHASADGLCRLLEQQQIGYRRIT